MLQAVNTKNIFEDEHIDLTEYDELSIAKKSKNT